MAAMNAKAPSPETLRRLKEAAGPKGWSEDAAEIAPHLVEWRDKYRGTTPLLLRPATTKEVAAIITICAETNTPLVPQGGNTGLVGGQIPNGEILLSLKRLNRVRAIDRDNNTLIAEAGCILADVQRAAEDADRLFPLSLSAEGSATIGGTLSTNAGGTNVLRYGNARDLALGLEVVLADGRVWNGLRGLRKDNTGYDLRQLFIGAEGTLGVITAAVLKLLPRPRTRETALVAVPHPEAAVALLHRIQSASGGSVTGFELMPRIGLSFVLRHIPGTRAPFAGDHPWIVLIELTSPARTSALRSALEETLSSESDKGLIRDAVIARNEREADDFWRLRDSMSEAQKPGGGSIKHDVSVPLSRIAAFLAEASEAVAAAEPGVRIVAFGHLGDGNIHFNLTQPIGADKEAFLSRWQALTDIVHTIVAAHGGSISAEHGLGIMKRDEITRYKSAVEIDLMRQIKRTLDPLNIMNPGKVVLL
jgi:D-lactate dehydrogenase (cytochrome)